MCPATIVLQGCHQRRKKKPVVCCERFGLLGYKFSRSVRVSMWVKKPRYFAGRPKTTGCKLIGTFAAPKVVKMRLQQVGRVKNLK